MRVPFASAAVVFAFSFLIGCAGARPPVSDGEPIDDGVSDETPADRESDTAETSTTTQTLGATTCAPGTLRTCKAYMVDESGYKRCPEGRQECRADGAGWTTCTMFAAGDSS